MRWNGIRTGHFYPHTNDDVLAVGVCMDDMTEENGCMLMVPGSHKGELYSHHENGVFVGAVSDPDFQAGETAKCLVKAGGITVHHARTLHASTPNHSANPRRLLLFEYCALDSWPLLTGRCVSTNSLRLCRPRPAEH